MSVPVVLIIEKSCRCPERRLPLRIFPAAVEWLRGITTPADLPVLTYRCHRCKSTVTLTAGDLHFAA